MTKLDKMISDIGAVRTLVDVVLAKGIEDVILSPGSRNAPFALSFTALKQFHCQSILDERSAGFVGLGIAQQRKKPVILCCTSGSAVLNYTPAMVEAYYQRIPLIALTADRPAARIDQGEGQTIRQFGAMQQFVVKTVQLVEEHREEDTWLNRRLVSEAIEWAKLMARPIHINVPLSEPLYNLKDWHPTISPKLRIAQGSHSFEPSLLAELTETWKRVEKIAILVTQRADTVECLDALIQLNNDPRIAIITETTSHLYHLGFVACIDRTLAAFLGKKEEEKYVPDLLITLGENIISKKIKGLLRKHSNKIEHHWHFGDDVVDTFEALTILLDGHPRPVLEVFAGIEVKSESRFGLMWRQRYFEMEIAHNEFVLTAPWSDLKAFEILLDMLPEQTVFQMGNSSVVRYVQLFSPVSRIHCFGNRGVSGIEGCTSTAVGAAQASDGLVVFVSGDQAFRYDSNALAVKHGYDNLRVIVINNEGGNIFRIIDGPEAHDVTSTYIEKHDASSIQGLVRHYGIEYLSATDGDSLVEALEDLLSPTRDKCAVLEVFTPRLSSPEVLQAYFKSLSSQV